MLSVISLRKFYKFGNPVVWQTLSITLVECFYFPFNHNHFTEILYNATDLTMGILFTDLLNDVDECQSQIATFWNIFHFFSLGFLQDSWSLLSLFRNSWCSIYIGQWFVVLKECSLIPTSYIPPLNAKHVLTALYSFLIYNSSILW